MLKLSVYMSPAKVLNVLSGGAHTAGDAPAHVAAVQRAYAACGVSWTPTFVCIAATARRQEGQASSAGGYGTERVPLLGHVLEEVVIATSNDLQNAATAIPPRRLSLVEGTPSERALLLTQLADASAPDLYAECRVHRPLFASDVDWNQYGVGREELELRVAMGFR